MLQKRLAEAYARAPHAAPLAPPLHIQPPGMASVIDMLNLINGILFVQIRYVVCRSLFFTLYILIVYNLLYLQIYIHTHNYTR